jgi:hypothetical protein
MEKRKSIVPPLFFGELKENIVVIRNFIKNDHLKIIQDFCKTLNTFLDLPNDDDYYNRICSSSILKDLSPEVHEILSFYQIKHKKIIEDFFNVSLHRNVPSVVIWRPGDFQHVHADKEYMPWDTREYPFPDNDIAALFYLNNEYTGGEIYFPIQDVLLKMNAGDAVFFPGDKEYKHEVREVKTGLRFTCVCFWKVTEILTKS